ncbi:MAG: O-antigen ligase family protein [Thermoguttaceae bacterium]|nr:O-antigen ligase family protein [Thermoguttaceae bacterium]
MSKGLIFTNLLTMVGIVFGILNPFVGLCIYICLAIINPTALWFFSVPEKFFGIAGYSFLVGVSMLVGWFFAGFGKWNLGQKAGLIVLLLVFNFFWMYISSAANGVLAYGASHQLIQFVKLYLAFFLGITIIHNIQQLKALIWVIILSEGYVAYDLNNSYMEGFNRLTEIGFAGLDNNFFVLTMVINAVLAFYTGLFETKLWRKGLAFFIAALNAHVIFFSMSRGGMLSLLISGIAIVWFIPKKPSYVLFMIIALCAALYMAGPSVRDRFASTFVDAKERDESSQGRLTSWKNCLMVMRDNPVFGIGLRQWLPYTRTKHGMQIEAHSMWMQASAEQGIPGILSLLGAFGLTILNLIRISKERTPTSDPYLHIAAQMAICALIGFCIGAQFVSVFALEISYYTIMIGCIVLKFQQEYDNQNQYVPNLASDQPYYRYE